MLHNLHCPLSGPDLHFTTDSIIEYVTNKQTLNLEPIMFLGAVLDCNVLMLSVLTIKGTGVIKPERKATWL